MVYLFHECDGQYRGNPSAKGLRRDYTRDTYRLEQYSSGVRGTALAESLRSTPRGWLEGSEGRSRQSGRTNIVSGNAERSAQVADLAGSERGSLERSGMASGTTPQMAGETTEHEWPGNELAARKETPRSTRTRWDWIQAPASSTRQVSRGYLDPSGSRPNRSRRSATRSLEREGCETRRGIDGGGVPSLPVYRASDQQRSRWMHPTGSGSCRTGAGRESYLRDLLSAWYKPSELAGRTTNLDLSDMWHGVLGVWQTSDNVQSSVSSRVAENEPSLRTEPSFQRSRNESVVGRSRMARSTNGANSECTLGRSVGDDIVRSHAMSMRVE